jgi:RNA polymerase sigma factor (sigma-70 family)
MTEPQAATAAAISAVFREETGRLCGSLVRWLGDFDLAEDLVQDAIVAALEHWPQQGIPDRPAAWLLQTARRRGIDRLRRDARYREKLMLLTDDTPETTEADDRLRLIFTCCHPALAPEARIALTLRAVLGMTTAQIARAFIVTETTMAQRIVRAKRKIVEAGIPYRVPASEELPQRLDTVLALIYLLYNEGFLGTAADSTSPRLSADAIWLGELVASLIPDQPETLALLALFRLHEARRPARFDSAGEIVLLQDQDRSLWDRVAITDAAAMLERARRLGHPGRYWLEAAIAAVHAEAPAYEDTDWTQILALYGELLRLVPTPVVRLNRAIALGHVAGPAPALDEIEELAGDLDRYHLYHATRAELLRAFGRHDEAREADRRAMSLTHNPAERSLLERRIQSAGSKDARRTV